jgi:membrane protein implicated in regulation of membrane protease activity
MESILSILSPMALFWLVAFLIFAAAEAATVGLVSIWFAAGALVSLVAAGFGASLPVQLVLFFAVSIVCLAALRPVVKKISVPHITATNADRHIGRQALVTEEINNLEETGAVRMDGVVWTARAEHDEIIPVGATITVCRISGVKVYVEPAPEPAKL